MKILSIIPARNNSKGIPGKNIVPLFGKPLISWNILAAKQSKFINRIIVSTDGHQIKKVSEEYGAEVIVRPDNLSGDSASSESALLHVIEELDKKENYKPDLIVFLQCTSPLTSTEDIDSCIEKILKEKADSATTVTDFHYFIWKNSLTGAEGINHEKEVRLRRQDRESQYLETGAVYVMRTKGFLQFKHRFFGKTVLSNMPANRVIEIDEPTDLEIAEAMMKNQQRKMLQDKIPDEIDTLFLDFDGVLTDDLVMVTQEGKEAVVCSREDGMGISLLKKAGINIVVLSTENNPVVSERCKKLEIECYQNLGNNKLFAMNKYIEENQINVQNIIFMGNDINDIECMKAATFSVAPKDANKKIKIIADYITSKHGGKGAVRELCDLIIDKIK